MIFMFLLSEDEHVKTRSHSFWTALMTTGVYNKNSESDISSRVSKE